MKGWFVANGFAGTPPCLDTFSRSATVSGSIAGSDNAVVVSHTHGISDPEHSHNVPCYESGTSGLQLISDDYTGIRQGHFTDGSRTGISINNEGVSGVGLNKPRYINSIPIIRMS